MIKKMVPAFGLIIMSLGFSGIAGATGLTTGKKKIGDKEGTGESTVSADNVISSLYESMNLSVLKLSKKAFIEGIKGMEKLVIQGKLQNSDIITIVDFSQASTAKRLYVIDLKNKVVLQNTVVSHGRNTGQLMASSFSNSPESNKSSLGFYVTSEVYQGKHGLSMRLDGMEKGINDNARNRGIVMHSADYATESFAKSAGYLGRSQGCPAVPDQLCKTIINTIKSGTCLFIFAPDVTYHQASSLAS